MLNRHLCCLFSLSCLQDKIPLVSGSLENPGLQLPDGILFTIRSQFFSCTETTKLKSAIPCFLTWHCCAGYGELWGTSFTVGPQTCRCKKQQQLLKCSYDSWRLLQLPCSFSHYFLMLPSLQYDMRNVNWGESLPCSHSKDNTWGLSLLHKLPVTSLLDQAACRERDAVNSEIRVLPL